MAKTASDAAKLFISLTRARWFEITYHYPRRFVVRATLQPAFCTPISQSYFNLSGTPKWSCKLSFPDVATNFSNGSHVLVVHDVVQTHPQHVHLRTVKCGSAKELDGGAPDDCNFHIVRDLAGAITTPHMYVIKLEDGEYSIDTHM
jgi:hypothetical protein